MAKQKAKEKGYIDIRAVPSHIVPKYDGRLYIISLIDENTQMACSEVITDVKILTAMFAALRLINIMAAIYELTFEEIVTDSNQKFGSKELKNKESHPFERLLMEIDVKHRYSASALSKTNKAVKSYWQELAENILNDATYKSIDALEDALAEYHAYTNYNVEE